ncbi:MAG: FlgD immunoglobulin-like domain containing protein [bacterium]
MVNPTPGAANRRPALSGRVPVLPALLALLLTSAPGSPSALLTPPFSHTLGFQRIGRYYLRLYLGSGFRVDDPQGMCGAKMTEEDDPTTSRDDHILTLFGVNSGTGQIVYNVKLLEPRIYGSEGPGTGEFRQPHGIACNPEGDVYVADTGNDRLVRLRYAGGRLVWVSVPDAALAAPRDVALDSRNRVYVTEYGADRVVVLDSSGARLAAWSGELDRPTGIAVIDQAAPYNQYGTDAAVVVDRDGRRLSLFSLDGRLRRQVDIRRLGLTEGEFSYAAFDRHGNCYVTDQLADQVHVFDPELAHIVSFGDDSRFNSPRGILLWRRFGQLFVNEAEGGQYYWVGLDGYLIGCYPAEFDSRRPGTTIALYVTGVADIEVHVTDAAGRLVRALTPPHDQRPGEVLIVWDGLDDRGALVPVGEYQVHAVIRPTYSTPRRIHKKELAGTVRRVADR